MKQLWILIVSACVLNASATAQNTFSQGSFTHIELHKVGTLKGNYQKGHLIERMTDGVKLTFVAEDPTQNLALDAKTIEFVYAAKDDQSPQKIVLSGNVHIKNSASDVRSDDAEIDLESGLATFTGNARMDSEAVQNLRASRIEMNMETGDYEVHNAESDRVNINLMDKEN